MATLKTTAVQSADSTNSKEVSNKVNKQTVYFAIFTLAWTALAMTASQYVCFLPMSWILGTKMTMPFWTFIYYVLNYLITLGLVVYVPPRLFELYSKNKQKRIQNNPFTTNSTELGLQHLPTFVDIGLAPIAYVVYAIGANLLTNLFKLFPWFQSNQAQETGFTYYVSAGDRAFAILALVIVAPVAEEIIMRGWLYGKLRSRLKVPIAILLVSLLFGLLHGQWNVGVGVFVLSVILCGLREITGTIWSGILLHILTNGIAFYLLYIAGF